jgi:7-keto-8-aminopelargonate synthetase-like enzyme
MCILSMMYAEKIPSRVTMVDNEEFLFFSGTSYLGMHARPEFGDLVKQGIELYGTNYGASRLGNITIPVFEQAEHKLANWLDAPATLLVSSGTLAGRLILDSLGSDYIYHFSANAHVAINPIYNASKYTNAFSCFIEDTLDSINFSMGENHVITFNTIDALTATMSPLNWISKLPLNKKIVLVIDDSHGIGVMGSRGKGLYENIKSLHAETIVISSLGKAMGLPAGLIAGPYEYIMNAKRHSLFGGSSPLVPAYAFAYLNADAIYDAAYDQLQNNIKYFLDNLDRSDLFSYTNHFPVFCTQHQEIAAYLEMNKIRISQFAYPSPKDKLYTRIILSALHTKADIHRLINLLNKF